MDDKNAQEEEVLALKSIYEENDMFSFDEASNSGKFYIKLELPETKLLSINFGKRLISIKLATISTYSILIQKCINI